MSKFIKREFTGGWIPDVPDFRDKIYKPLLAVPKPKIVVPRLDIDFRKDKIMPIHKDQTTIGSCVGHGCTTDIEFNMLNKQTKKYDPKVLPFSPLFTYYNARAIDGTVKYDAGTYIRTGFKTIARDGVCREKTWPYKVSKYTTRPTPNAYTEALNFKSLVYSRVENTQPLVIQDALNNSFMIVFGMTVYDSFLSTETEQTGIVKMPKKGERVQGGHCCVIIGVNNKAEMYLCQNSWGVDWGIGGDFWIPMKYLNSSNLASDFWLSKMMGPQVVSMAA